MGLIQKKVLDIDNKIINKIKKELMLLYIFLNSLNFYSNLWFINITITNKF